MSLNTAKLLDALMFAAEAHKDQRRKGNGGSPYVNHLIEVASLLSNIAKVSETDVLIAAILHDTLEDTQVLECDISSRYGDEVLNYVKSVTDDKALTLEERRDNQVRAVASSSDQIKLIKLADHSSNIASLPPSWDKHRLESYLAWSYEVTNNCFVVSSDLANEYKQRFKKAREIVSAKPA
jgi:guanosine-3',5'-bis(diphosphate) 3'-pyrophosphohydrolase